MSDLSSKLWVKKYKPTTIQDYIFQNDQQKALVQSIVSEDMVGHALFSGIQGTGKTSLSDVLVNELKVLPSDVKRINCSDETSIDVIRGKVVGFVSVIPDGKYRLVQLEECDFLSFNAQASLRVLLEDYVDQAKFILTCNYIYKIIPALKSRCQYQFDFKSPEKKSTVLRVLKILMAENITFDKKLIMPYVDACYPDLRKTIQTIQQHCVDGVLLEPSSVGSGDDYKFKILEYLEKNDWKAMREVVCAQVPDDEIVGIYKFLFENLNKCKKFKDYEAWGEGYVMIAKYLHRDSTVAIRETNLAALFIELGTI